MGRIPLLVRIFTIALAVAACAPAAALAWMPQPVQFERSVAQGGAHSASLTRTLDVPTGRRFDLVGLSWAAGRGSRGARIELRTHMAHRGWTRWAHVSAADDGAPATEARGERGRTFSDPIWAGGSDRVELRLSRPLAGLRLRLINTTGSATRADRRRTRDAVARRGAFGAQSSPLPRTSAAEPPILPRSAWGASRCKPRVTPAYGDVRVAYVHHTESLNGYSRAGAASMVLGICLFHRNSRGWNDIGYDFLVDRYGRVFEGRSGGVDAPVIGAHAGGFNSESTGVSLLGSFTSASPTQAAMHALTRLLAWKLALHGVPATGRTQVTSAGGSATRYPAGTKVTVNRISGHRDVDLTACPGARLYARLPALRRSVAGLEGAFSQLAITGPPAPVQFGTGYTATGRLTVPGGADPAGAQIELRQLTGGAERVLGATTAAPDGSWSAQLPAATGTAPIRAVFAGDGSRPGVVSNTGLVVVAPQVALAATPTTVPARGSVVATGTVRPAKARVRVTAYLVRPDGGLRKVASRTVGARSARYRAKLRLKGAGTYRLVTRAGPDAASTGGRSAPFEVQVSP